ncbi:hypothetical protein PUN28_016887 [Cardiocondyla obscurior]|uniref:Uncharacterized protein n=1 Tax=Cardiocondyla obscurior TaxID=286306 RepID=A0AAW2EP60_9HYME
MKTCGFKCYLADILVTLMVNSVACTSVHYLIGVIEHIPKHFIAYCRKPSGQ